MLNMIANPYVTYIWYPSRVKYSMWFFVKVVNMPRILGWTLLTSKSNQLRRTGWLKVLKLWVIDGDIRWHTHSGGCKVAMFIVHLGFWYMYGYMVHYFEWSFHYSFLHCILKHKHFKLCRIHVSHVLVR